MKRLILAFIFLLAHNAQAEELILIEPGTPIAEQIDQTYFEIFQSPLKNTLCTLFKSGLDIHFSLGVSPRMGQSIFSLCPARSTSGGFSKSSPKKYYISSKDIPGLESWTDQVNRTFIYSAENLSKELLKSILIHELAISFDSKTRMMLTHYMRHQAFKKNPHGRELVIEIPNDAPALALQEAFNIALWEPFAVTFAALRAFAIEEIVNAGALTRLTHNQCTLKFRELLSVVRDLKSPIKSQNLSAQEMVDELLNRYVNQSFPLRLPEEEALNFIFDEGLQLEDLTGKKVSFCQYMTLPVMEGKSFYNHFGYGPRPRPTGGGGGQGDRQLSIDPSSDMVQQAMQQLIKQKQNEAPAARPAFTLPKQPQSYEDLLQKIQQQR